MSIDTCKDCGDPVDTDNDTDCYVYVGNYKRLHDTICLCPRCRDKHYTELEEQDARQP